MSKRKRAKTDTGSQKGKKSRIDGDDAKAEKKEKKKQVKEDMDIDLVGLEEEEDTTRKDVVEWLQWQDYNANHQPAVLFLEYIHTFKGVAGATGDHITSDPGPTPDQGVRGALPVHYTSNRLVIGTERTSYPPEAFEYMRNALCPESDLSKQRPYFRTVVVYSRIPTESIPAEHVSAIQRRLYRSKVVVVPGALPAPLPAHREPYDLHAFVRATLDKYVDVKTKQGDIGKRFDFEPASWNAILPGLLFLSNLQAANDSHVLNALDIQDIVSLGGGLRAETRERKGMQTIEALFEDRAEESKDKMAEFLPRALDFMNEAIVKNRRPVLVHCGAGISRSSTVVIAFLVQHLGISLREAIVIATYHRHKVDPYTGFLHVLQNWFMDRTATRVKESPQPMDFLDFQELMFAARQVCKSQDSSVSCCWCRPRDEK